MPGSEMAGTKSICMLYLDENFPEKAVHLFFHS